ncbi:hypothetical protein ABBQ32_005990 [Trebouxia sp. C0010 RCD-2024]
MRVSATAQALTRKAASLYTGWRPLFDNCQTFVASETEWLDSDIAQLGIDLRDSEKLRGILSLEQACGACTIDLPGRGRKNSLLMMLRAAQLCSVLPTRF